MDESSLQKQLQEYRAAIESEFELNEKHKEGLNRENIAEKTKEMLTHAVPIAVSKLVYLVEYADKDTTQLSAAKYIIDYALGKGKLESPDDPLKDLITSINKSARENAASEQP
jgi:NAD(P)H-hydrate repair Nnr-like enzyme with NAD(P)H-hydrate epimerase domain